MNKNTKLAAARRIRNDEYYTRFCDVEDQIGAYLAADPDLFAGRTILLPCDDPEWSNFTRFFAGNFRRLKLKKLISTSYVHSDGSRRLSACEAASPHYDPLLHATCGKLFVLREEDEDPRSPDHLPFTYLEGDGDFRSPEVARLRDEADIIITNPPFSLFREFMQFLQEGKKDFIIVASDTTNKYKEIFRLLKTRQIWPGPGFRGTAQFYTLEDPDEVLPFGITIRKGECVEMNNACWLTNLPFVGGPEPLILDTLEHNLKYSRPLRKRLRSKFGSDEAYPRYANFDALEVPLVECIPKDYAGVMGVPVSFLNRWDPDQFELLGRSGDREWAENECEFYRPPSAAEARRLKSLDRGWRPQHPYVLRADGTPNNIFERLFIRARQPERQKEKQYGTDSASGSDSGRCARRL